MDDFEHATVRRLRHRRDERDFPMENMPMNIADELRALNVPPEVPQEEPEPPAPPEQEPAEFVTLSNRSVDAMVQAFEHALGEAQTALEQAKREADEIRAKIDLRHRDLIEMTARHRTMGEQILAAVRKGFEEQ